MKSSPGCEFHMWPQLLMSLNLSQVLSSTSQQIYTTVLSGFEDYAVDQRGDVGSWVRMATLQAVAAISRAVFARRDNLENFGNYLPPGLWHKAIGDTLKQGVERLDNVRAVAGEQMMTLIWDTDIRMNATGSWAIPGAKKLESVFPS